MYQEIVWNFKDLRAWQLARGLIVDVYELTDRFPPSERFAMTSQMRRAANSIGANIAEACGRTTEGERAQFFGYAIASADETEHHLIIGKDVGLITASEARRLIKQADVVRKMTKGLRRSCVESE